MFRLSLWLSIACLCSLSPAHASEPDLTELSIDQLLGMPVVTVSRKPEPLGTAAAAIFLVSGDDIRRMGIRRLADALRLVPGLQVAQVNGQDWAITGRGFNSPLPDKLEVRLDGRSLYTDLYSGVFWDIQDTLLLDIDRIEVVRGPGASLWGANAVNAVINIVTKSAAETTGGVAAVFADRKMHEAGGVRYGWRVNDSGHIRVYAKNFRQRQAPSITGGHTRDAMRLTTVGLRSDWRLDKRNSLTLQGDAYDSRNQDTFSSTGFEEIQGWNLIGRWNRDLASGGDIQLQLTLEDIDRDIRGYFREHRSIQDLELKHSLAPRGKHALVWGGSLRSSRDNVPPTPAIMFDPASRRMNYVDFFLHDQIKLADELTLTLGSKFEDHPISGFEIQPTARIAWAATTQQTLWAAVSRAVRTPNRIDRDFSVPPALVGNDDFESEVAIVYEIGFRLQPTPSLSLDIATYFNRFDKLRGIDISGPAPVVSNEGEGDISGIELLTIWSVMPGWRLWGGYTYLKADYHPKSGSSDPTIETLNQTDPRHQAFIRSAFDLHPRIELDLMLRHVTELPDALLPNGNAVPAYTELDLRLGWMVLPELELELTGRNLLDDKHAEFSGDPVSLMERRIGAGISWHF